MATEIEIKVFEIDKDKVEKKIQQFGAKLVEKGHMHTDYFATGNTDSFVRIRSHNDTTKLGYKNIDKSSGMQINEEHEVEVSNHRTTSHILDQLGAKRICNTQRERISYQLGTIHFDFDKYDHLPWFLEIEAPSQEEVIQRVNKLGLENNPQSGDAYKHFKDDYPTFIQQLRASSQLDK